MANLKIIKEIAKSKNMSIESLAKAVGLKAHAIHKIARDGTTTIDTLERIAKALDVPTWLFLDDKLTLEEVIKIVQNGHHNSLSVMGAATVVDAPANAEAAAIAKTLTTEDTQTPTPDTSVLLELKDALIKNLEAQVAGLCRDKERLEKEVDRLRAKYEPDS